MCAVCMISVYIFARSLLFFYPPSPLPPMQFSALCKQKSAAKKKEKKKRIVSLSKNFDRFFSPLPHFDNFDTGANFHRFLFFNSFYHSTRENWLRLILEPNPLSRPGYDLFFLLEGEGEKWEHNL